MDELPDGMRVAVQCARCGGWLVVDARRAATEIPLFELPQEVSS
ncbi:hypothetical protein [Nocardia sp. NPDC046763]